MARCPECRRFFCRECVTEHDDQLLCASCLRKAAEKEDHKAGISAAAAALSFARAAVSVGMGFALAWAFFAMLLILVTLLPTTVDWSKRGSPSASSSSGSSTTPGEDPGVDGKGE